MKKASLIAASLVAVLVASPVASAYAMSASVSAGSDISVHGKSVDHRGSGDADLDDDTNVDFHNANATSTVHMNEHASTTMQRNHGDDRDDDMGSTTASTTDRGHGHKGDDHQGMGELHRSVVASFVQSLLADANRDGGIGAQVRAVAQHQNDTASTTADAMSKVENRSKLLTILFGADWNNLSAVKAQINATQNDIATLQVALDKATDAQVKADLSAQIQVLQQEEARMQAFVDAHESGFSLLGWFTKLFAKDDSNS